MPTVDEEHHEVRFQIAVIGGVSSEFLEHLNLKDGELQLGEVQSYRPRFAFQTFPDDPWSGDGAAGKTLEELIPYLDALVLTDSFDTGRHYSSEALERLASKLSPIKLRIPAALYGGPALAQEWESLSGAQLVHVAEPQSEHALPTVKALAKALLRAGMKSTPPPPSAH